MSACGDDDEKDDVLGDGVRGGGLPLVGDPVPTALATSTWLGIRWW